MITGESPRGPRGEVGPRGARGESFTRAQTMFLFIFVVVAFLLLAYRSEVNTAAVRANDAQIARQELLTTIESCESALDTLQRFNQQQLDLAANDRQGLLEMRLADRTPELQVLLEDRIRIYERGVQPLPDCDALPRP